MFSDLNILNNLKAFSGYYKNTEKLLQSSSGGGANAIAEAVIKDGGVVFGAAYSPDFKSAEFALIENIYDLYKIKGSKYIETKKKIFHDGKYQPVYNVVAEKLIHYNNCNGGVLFTGLGCDAAALYAFLNAKKIDTSKLFTIDLFCHGTTYSEAARQYIESIEKKFNSNVIDFTVRYKKEGWTPPHILAKFRSGKTFCENFYKSDYGYAFLALSNDKCYNCKFKGENHRADLTVGDYWGLNENMEGYNPNGVSIFIVRTEKGMELINKIDKSEFLIKKTDVKFALSNNKMYFMSRSKDDGARQFKEDLFKIGLHRAVIRHYGISRYILTRSPLAVITRIARKILPKSIKNFIKFIVKF